MVEVANHGLFTVCLHGFHGMPGLLRPHLPLLMVLFLVKSNGGMAEIPVAPHDVLKATGKVGTACALSKAVNLTSITKVASCKAAQTPHQKPSSLGTDPRLAGGHLLHFHWHYCLYHHSQAYLNFPENLLVFSIDFSYLFQFIFAGLNSITVSNFLLS